MKHDRSVLSLPYTSIIPLTKPSKLAHLETCGKPSIVNISLHRVFHCGLCASFCPSTNQAQIRTNMQGHPTSLWFPPPRPRTPVGACPSLPPRPQSLGLREQDPPPPPHHGRGGMRGPRSPPLNRRRSSPPSWSHHWMSFHTCGEGRSIGSVGVRQWTLLLFCVLLKRTKST